MFYGECWRNHAVATGNQVYDGCRKFMPRGGGHELYCDACGCHRNYHRASLFPMPSLHSFAVMQPLPAAIPPHLLAVATGFCTPVIAPYSSALHTHNPIIKAGTAVSLPLPPPLTQHETPPLQPHHPVVEVSTVENLQPPLPPPQPGQPPASDVQNPIIELESTVSLPPPLPPAQHETPPQEKYNPVMEESAVKDLWPPPRETTPLQQPCHLVDEEGTMESLSPQMVHYEAPVPRTHLAVEPTQLESSSPPWLPNNTTISPLKQTHCSMENPPPSLPLATHPKQEEEVNSKGGAHEGAAGMKRKKTRFTEEQRKRMRAFAEKVEWRVSKEDEEMMKAFSEEIRVGVQSIKVWINNHRRTIGTFPSMYPCSTQDAGSPSCM